MHGMFHIQMLYDVQVYDVQVRRFMYVNTDFSIIQDALALSCCLRYTIGGGLHERKSKRYGVANCMILDVLPNAIVHFGSW